MKVTIGLPFVNDYNTIKATISSIYAQTFSDWELLCVDDGSTDGTYDLLKKINDPRVKVYRDGYNKQLSYRLNQIHEMAEGQYIARMDSDDIMHPDRLRQQIDYLDKNPNIDIVGSAVWFFNNHNQIFELHHSEDINLAVLPRKVIYIHPTVMARRELFETFKYSADFVRAEDLELWCRMAYSARVNFGKIQEPLLYYRRVAQGTLEKTLLSYHTQRRIITIYGPQFTGFLPSVYMWTESYAKAILHRVFQSIGVRDILLKNNRANEIPASRLVEAHRVLQSTINTYVPGWDSSSDMANHKHASSNRAIAA